MPEYRYAYDPRDLNYIAAKAKPINDTATLLRVPPPGIAGGIVREMTLTRYAYPWKPDWLAGQPVKGFLTSKEPVLSVPESDMLNGFPAEWRPLSHQTIANGFALANTPGGTLKFPPPFAGLGLHLNALWNPALFDVGPGNIKIRTAISMLQNYSQMFPDSDPLNLKRYNQHYDLLVRDLKDPDSNTTVKIAGLVAREGQDFFVNAMTPQRWAALSDDRRAATLTKYYAVGKERMQDDFARKGGNPNTYTPDFSGDGSDIYLHRPANGPSNAQSLGNALSPGPQPSSSPNPRVNSIGSGGSAYADANAGNQPAAPQTAAAGAGPVAGPPLGVPPHVIASGNYLSANGFAVTPRSLYVANVLGPQRAVDLFRRTGSTSSPDVPFPDAETGRQTLAWVRALRGGAAAPAAGVGPPAPAYSGDANASTDEAADATAGLPQ
jgi:hypothetical protein